MREPTRILLLAMIPLGLTAQNADAPKFEKDILPIFTEYCFTCHGKSSPKLGLDLRTAVSTLQGSHNGSVITKRSPDKSLLFEKISKREMPPVAFKATLPDNHIETIRKWIEGGARSEQSGSARSKEVSEQRARFDKEVLPIFQQRCVACHGSGKPMAGLDLRSFSSSIAGGVNGAVIVEGFSE